MREELIMLTAAELDVENTRPTDFPGTTPGVRVDPLPLKSHTGPGPRDRLHENSRENPVSRTPDHDPTRRLGMAVPSRTPQLKKRHGPAIRPAEKGERSRRVSRDYAVGFSVDSSVDSSSASNSSDLSTSLLAISGFTQ